VPSPCIAAVKSNQNELKAEKRGWATMFLGGIETRGNDMTGAGGYLLVLAI
jgi:hypothetical protein